VESGCWQHPSSATRAELVGTSSAFEGQGGHTPLIPSWLDEPSEAPGEAGSTAVEAPADENPDYSDHLPRSGLPPIGDPNRFTAARSNFTRFARSGGRDSASLGRAISRYVSSSAGGSQSAAARMGSSRASAGRLAGFLADAARRGAVEALRALNLEALAGRPIEEVFAGLADYVCPDGGSIDEGIARSAFIETIAELAQLGITDLDGLTPVELQTVFETYATNAIEARICNDIGAKVVTVPADARQAAQVQAQLHDFIRRGVSDALVQQPSIASLPADAVMGFVSKVYQQAFEILQDMGDAEATTS
ncbi:Qat anti-phage system associated protein QatB, partial [Mycolicibacterium gadium]